jgi:hypothetical protein
MIEAIVTIVLIAFVGSLGVPLVMFMLACFGYFPPITINAFGRVWKFEPRMKFVTTRADMAMQANTAITDNSMKTTAAVSIFAVVCMPKLARDA